MIRLNEEHEEFLTLEDFESVNKKILDTYPNKQTEIIIDGYDVIKALTKKELAEDLDNIAKKLVKKYH